MPEAVLEGVSSSASSSSRGRFSPADGPADCSFGVPFTPALLFSSFWMKGAHASALAVRQIAKEWSTNSRGVRRSSGADEGVIIAIEVGEIFFSVGVHLCVSDVSRVGVVGVNKV